MIALIIITVVVVTLYVLTGRKLAIRNLPRAWKIGRREWSAKKYVRTSVKCQTVCMFFFWPYYGSFILLAAHLDKVIDAGDRKHCATSWLN